MNNFFTIKSSFGETKNIQTPQDLYPLKHDEDYQTKKLEAIAEQASKPLTDFEKELLGIK